MKPRYGELRGLVERAIRSCSRHDMAAYAMALSYRNLLALFAFAGRPVAGLRPTGEYPRR